MKINQNQYYDYLNDSIKFINDLIPKKVETAIIEDAILEVSQHFEKVSTKWTKIKALFASLVGYTTKYKELKLKIEHLEKQLNGSNNGNFSERTTNHQKLISNQAQLNEVGLSIKKEVVRLIKEFNKIDKNITDLNTKIKGSPNNSKLMNDASEIARSIKSFETQIETICEAYVGDSKDLSPIAALYRRYNNSFNRIIQLQRQMTEKAPSPPKSSIRGILNGGILPTQGISLGGIQNGGNTCYLASAIQAINAVPSYRVMFDPVLKPLKQRPAESDESYAQRCKIQRQGFKIIKNSATGKITPKHQINAFRKSCFEFKFKGVSIVDSLWGTADATETLNRLLEAMDYEFETFQVEEYLDDVDAYIISKDYEKNPSDYSLLEDVKKEKVEKNSIIQLSTFALLNHGTPLQTLIDESWKAEKRSGYYQGFDDNGIPFVQQYTDISVVRNPVMADAPEVVRVMVSQDEYNKVTLSQIQTIYPFGNGKGPQYELKAVIEHRPGHYVAHISNGNKGIIEANDSLITKRQRLIPGVAYYYVRKDV